MILKLWGAYHFGIVSRVGNVLKNHGTLALWIPNVVYLPSLWNNPPPPPSLSLIACWFSPRQCSSWDLVLLWRWMQCYFVLALTHSRYGLRCVLTLEKVEKCYGRTLNVLYQGHFKYLTKLEETSRQPLWVYIFLNLLTADLPIVNTMALYLHALIT